jgi:hypothetical protein
MSCSMAPTSHTCASAMLLILIVWNLKLGGLGELQCHNIHTGCGSFVQTLKGGLHI